MSRDAEPVAATLLVPALPPGGDLERLEPILLRAWDGAAPRLSTEVRLGHDRTRLRAHFRAAYDRLHLDPEPPSDRPVPGLWRHDVVELFVAAADGAGYREIEVSPLGQWLALAFAAPRRAAAEPWRPRLEIAAAIGAGSFDVRVAVPLADLGIAAGPAGTGAARLGLFRVHGAPPGREHFGQLATGGDRPDFHRPWRWPALRLGD
jgi:hypothetical protein